MSLCEYSALISPVRAAYLHSTQSGSICGWLMLPAPLCVGSVCHRVSRDASWFPGSAFPQRQPAGVRPPVSVRPPQPLGALPLQVSPATLTWVRQGFDWLSQSQYIRVCVCVCSNLCCLKRDFLLEWKNTHFDIVNVQMAYLMPEVKEIVVGWSPMWLQFMGTGAWYELTLLQLFAAVWLTSQSDQVFWKEQLTGFSWCQADFTSSSSLFEDFGCQPSPFMLVKSPIWSNLFMSLLFLGQ